MFKVNNGNIRTRCGICSKLTIKTRERRNWRRSGVFIINFGTYFTPCSSVFIVNFEQVNTGWVVFSALGIFGSSHLHGFHKLYVLKNFAKLTGKHLCRRLFWYCRLQGCNFIKKELDIVVLLIFLRIPFSKNTSGRLPLYLFQLFATRWVTKETSNSN